MKFSEWLKLKEDAAPAGATVTTAIAGYVRPIFSSPIVRGDFFPRKKHKKKV